MNEQMDFLGRLNEGSSDFKVDESEKREIEERAQLASYDNEPYCAQCETGYCERHMGEERRKNNKI